MKKVLFCLALAWVGATALRAGTNPVLLAQASPAAAPQRASATSDSAAARAYLKQYCISCHGNRNPQPSN